MSVGNQASKLRGQEVLVRSSQGLGVGVNLISTSRRDRWVAGSTRGTTEGRRTRCCGRHVAIPRWMWLMRCTMVHAHAPSSLFGYCGRNVLLPYEKETLLMFLIRINPWRRRRRGRAGPSKAKRMAAHYSGLSHRVFSLIEVPFRSTMTLKAARLIWRGSRPRSCQMHLH